jgi:hypothetical protein
MTTGNQIGPLVPADEGFNHQIADTFAVVGTSDLGWTEKVCAMAAARDGSLQLGFGLGKYPNRNVMDAYAAISRGTEQITVRSSRRLAPDPDVTAIGPIRYEVVEPLRSVRFVCEPNDCQPIAFEWLFEAVVPPFVEDRTHVRAGYRVASDLVRYHQIGVGSGWVEIDGERSELSPHTWVSTRDHSWGVRMPAVGMPVTDLEPAPQIERVPGLLLQVLWSPVMMERPDGSRYGLWIFYQLTDAPGFQQRRVEGAIEHPDGRVERIVGVEPDLTFDPVNRRLRGGTIHATMGDGSTRPLHYEAVSETGVHLGAGLYFGFDGHHHGEWRGALHVDGERIENCVDREQARRLHQLRDTVVHVVDPVGGGEGWGNAQPIIAGGSARHGLDAADSFI